MEEEYGEFLARPKELASIPVNDIVKSIRLNGGAMTLGRKVYDKACAACHGADLKGRPDLHTPDLTDADWRFSGDDLASGGNVKYPSDVEWTVRYGIRSSHPNARGLEADMLAYDPKYRTKDDIKEFGGGRFLTPEEIEDVAEYVLQISGQGADAAKATRGGVLFQDGAKGNCFDCHGADGTGYDPIGSTNLTQTRLYLYGSDRASIFGIDQPGASRRLCRRSKASQSPRRSRRCRSTSCPAPQGPRRRRCRRRPSSEGRRGGAQAALAGSAPRSRGHRDIDASLPVVRDRSCSTDAAPVIRSKISRDAQTVGVESIVLGAPRAGRRTKLTLGILPRSATYHASIALAPVDPR